MRTNETFYYSLCVYAWINTSWPVQAGLVKAYWTRLRYVCACFCINKSMNYSFFIYLIIAFICFLYLVWWDFKTLFANPKKYLQLGIRICHNSFIFVFVRCLFWIFLIYSTLVASWRMAYMNRRGEKSFLQDVVGGTWF